MSEFFYALSGCLAMGITTTIHPCPLAANIAAISLIAGTSRSKKRLVSIVLFFSLGYIFSLLGAALLVNFSLVSIPKLSVFIQSVMSAFLGPLLILVGMVVSEMIKLGHWFSGLLPKKEFWENKPLIYVFLLGALLAITFCPATAFIYFGVMIPLSVDHNQIILFPLVFATGALLPIITVGILINHGSIAILREKWTAKIPLIAGWALIVVGIFITLERLYVS